MRLVLSATGALVLVLVVDARAAPTGNSGTLIAAAAGMSDVAQVARRCWWRQGVRYCRGYRTAPAYGYRGYEGPHYPEAYPTGSARWWQEMDRQDRGGRGSRR